MARRKILIRRKRVGVALPVSSGQQVAQVEDDGDDSFVSGFRSGDFIPSTLEGDFVSDNEVSAADELIDEFEEFFEMKSNEWLREQATKTANSLGKMYGEAGKL